MTATKILWGQILVVFTIVLATMWGATEWTAWRLGFQPRLGLPWFEFADVPVYFLDHEVLFGRDGIYGSKTEPSFHDNLRRFALLDRGAFQLCRSIDWFPDVMHVHDWPGAVVPWWLRSGAWRCWATSWRPRRGWPSWWWPWR